LLELENTYISKYEPGRPLLTPEMKLGEGQGETPNEKIVDRTKYPPWFILPSAIDANINA
jgi:hypothetical protein